MPDPSNDLATEWRALTQNGTLQAILQVGDDMAARLEVQGQLVTDDVERRANDLTVALTEQLLMETHLDEDADCAALERWGDYADKLLAAALKGVTP